jgi:hypothetical protein
MSTPKAAAPPSARGFFSRGSATPAAGPPTNTALVPSGLPLYTAFADTSMRPVMVYCA